MLWLREGLATVSDRVQANDDPSISRISPRAIVGNSVEPCHPAVGSEIRYS